MYVCNCAGVTQREIYRRLQQGTVDLKALQDELGLCQGCGKCTQEVCEMLKHCEHAQHHLENSQA